MAILSPTSIYQSARITCRTALRMMHWKSSHWSESTSTYPMGLSLSDSTSRSKRISRPSLKATPDTPGRRRVTEDEALDPVKNQTQLIIRALDVDHDITEESPENIARFNAAVARSWSAS